MNIESTRSKLADFRFHELFVEELGWSQPSMRRPQLLEIQGIVFHQRMLAQPKLPTPWQPLFRSIVLVCPQRISSNT